MKKLMKIMSIMLIAVMMISITLPTLATVDGVDVGADMSKIQSSSAGSSLKAVLGALRYIGIFAAVAILMVIGIKYMMGSAEEKAEYKKTLIPYVLGAILLFAASFIVGVIAEATNKTIATTILTNTMMYLG